MRNKVVDQTFLVEFSTSLNLTNLLDAFITDRRSRQFSPNTIHYYKVELGLFARYLEQVKILSIEEITPTILRNYLLELGNKRNPGGLLVSFRAIHTFLNWTWDELELEMRNPISKLQAPKVSAEPQPGIALENIQKMVEACTGTQPQRDRALLLALLDSGARAFEILAIKVGDIDLLTGEIAIRRGKGGKARAAFLGQRARKELRKYLKTREGLAKGSPLFVTDEGAPLTYWGLRQILRRVAKRAGISEPGAHDFRRAFCLAMLRQGVDLVTISRLMGHKDINLIRRYANQNNEDLHIAHQKASPVELLR